jgi:alpha-L-fucosidase
MRRILLLAFCLSSLHVLSQGYAPSPGNLATRKQFQDDKFGLFIHWGLSSVLGDGEWVMETRGIPFRDYVKLGRIFNPIHYDPAKWVSMAKDAGMKYIVFITRHHDGFSNWDTKQSDWKITNTPYGKDALKMLAEECRKQGMKLGLYYSILDWSRTDYPYETGRTGKKAGRTGTSDYASYLAFMKGQLTELLTGYGPISCIWLDGHWDQTEPEGSADRKSRIDWRYDELYGLIHRLQPSCMIGNNHHLDPFPGEDFQMFEQDLPGQNKSGLSFQQASTAVPLESCITMNGSWGFNIKDTRYKSYPEIVRTLAGAAGRNSNLLLNVGPMPNGEVQSEFIDTLKKVGEWVRRYGHTVYGTRGGPTPPEEWGVTTQTETHVYLHLFGRPPGDAVTIPGYFDSKSVTASDGKAPVVLSSDKNGLRLDLSGHDFTSPDLIVTIPRRK